MDIEFKEKPYEMYFSHEIARLTNISYAPDQCDENFLGFDGAFYIGDVWRGMFPYVRARRRARLDDGITIHHLDYLTRRQLAHMPPFRFNLFVQYKRPSYLMSRGAREWGSWNIPYYRFDITRHQQRLLERLEAISHGRAATIYASPAFYRSVDLFNYAQSNTIIDNSNIAAAGRLTGHGCYTYAHPGQYGIGHSEPQQIESTPLKMLLKIGLEANEELNAKDHILKLGGVIREAADGDSETVELLKSAEDLYIVDESESVDVIKALITILALSDAFSISTYMQGGGRE